MYVYVFEGLVGKYMLQLYMCVYVSFCGDFMIMTSFPNIFGIVTPLSLSFLSPLLSPLLCPFSLLFSFGLFSFFFLSPFLLLFSFYFSLSSFLSSFLSPLLFFISPLLPSSSSSCSFFFFLCSHFNYWM